MHRELLKVDGLTVEVKSNSSSAFLLRDVGFSVGANECLVILGESGSGKSTLARALTSLVPPHRGIHIRGSVSLDGEDLLTDQSAKARVRYVLQEPAMALNPVLKIGAQVKILSGSRDLSGITARLRSQQIRDPERVYSCYPHEISAGMAQRVLIAVALNAGPRLLVCDEPTSAVDLESRELILDILQTYVKESGNALVLVTHDLVLARRIATNIVVLYSGLIVESAPAAEFYKNPLHPYSQALLSMVPEMGSNLESMPALPSAEGKSVSGGCVYAAACVKVQSPCREHEPALERISSSRSARCPYWK